jgi:glycosyltransferase involved in cell wall biosynthesis
VDVIEEGVTGRLVTPGDAAALEDALEALLSDPARREEMGRRARERACGRFDVEDSLDRYRALFHEVAAAAAGGKA